ncbi:MAG: hypothetical protein OHK0028_08200 [Deltaproteobacteria bacterium]
MRRALSYAPLLFYHLLFLPVAVSAGEATFEPATPGVVRGSTAAVARAAAHGVSGGLSADADMSKHSVTVKRNDPKRFDAVIKALNDAGYTVGTPKLLDAEKES